VFPPKSYAWIAVLILAVLATLPLAGVVAEPPAAAPAPMAITLGPRHGHVTPMRQGFTHTGAGIVQVTQPTPDSILITMIGAAMAGAHPCKDSFASLDFDLVQAFEITPPNRKPVAAKLVVEARALGLLRSYRSGCCNKAYGNAEMSEGTAAVSTDGTEVIAVALEPHAVGGDEDLSINDHVGPIEASVAPGKHTLHQRFRISAAHVRSLLPCGHASAEFAPESALDPLWLGNRESFHGLAKKDLGFQVSLRVVVDAAETELPQPEPGPAPQCNAPSNARSAPGSFRSQPGRGPR